MFHYYNVYAHFNNLIKKRCTTSLCQPDWNGSIHSSFLFRPFVACASVETGLLTAVNCVSFADCTMVEMTQDQCCTEAVERDAVLAVSVTESSESEVAMGEEQDDQHAVLTAMPVDDTAAADFISTMVQSAKETELTAVKSSDSTPALSSESVFITTSSSSASSEQEVRWADCTLSTPSVSDSESASVSFISTAAVSAGSCDTPCSGGTALFPGRKSKHLAGS